MAGGLDHFRSMVAELASEFDPMDVAAAAAKLAHEASHAEADAHADEQDVPLDASAPRRDRPEPPRSARGEGRDPGGHQRSGNRGTTPTRPTRSSAGRRGDAGDTGGGFRSTRLFIGTGRLDGIRPGDLVGAITNEANLTSEDIGAIEIADCSSLVEVRSEHASSIVKALRGTTLRGRKVIVRRDRNE